MEGIKKRSLGGSFVTLLSQGIRMVIQLGSQLILARLLFPTDFGLLAMVYPVISFIQIFNDIGLGQAIVQRPTLEQEQVSALFWVNILLSCGLACVVAMVAPLAVWVYREPRVLNLMLVLGLLIPLSALGIHPAALMSRKMRFGWMARIEIVGSLTGVVVTVLCAWRAMSYWSLVAGQAASTVVGIALAWRVCGWRPSRPSFSHSVWDDLKFGGNVTGANLATFLPTSGDNIIVGLTTGSVSLGLYDRSYRLVVQPLGQMLSPVSRVAVPLLSRLNDQPHAYRATYLKIFRTLLLISIPIMLVCIVEGDAIVRVLLGRRWIKAGPIFSWVCVGGLTSGIYSSAYWMYISQARTRELRLFTTGISVINIASFLIGALWGIIGVAAFGAVVFVTVTTPIMLYGATRAGPVHFRDIIRYGAPFAAGAVVVYTGLILAKVYLHLHDLERIMVAIFLSSGSFSGLMLMRSGERRLLRELGRTLVVMFKERGGRSERKSVSTGL